MTISRSLQEEYFIIKFYTAHIIVCLHLTFTCIHNTFEYKFLIILFELVAFHQAYNQKSFLPARSDRIKIYQVMLLSTINRNNLIRGVSKLVRDQINLKLNSVSLNQEITIFCDRNLIIVYMCSEVAKSNK